MCALLLEVGTVVEVRYFFKVPASASARGEERR